MMRKDKNRKAVLGCGNPRGGYSEDAPDEQLAISLLDDLGWEMVNAYHELGHI